MLNNYNLESKYSDNNTVDYIAWSNSTQSTSYTWYITGKVATSGYNTNGTLYNFKTWSTSKGIFESNYNAMCTITASSHNAVTTLTYTGTIPLYGIGNRAVINDKKTYKHFWNYLTIYRTIDTYSWG